MGQHKWKCISPGMYDDLMECENCGKQFMEQADAFPHGQAPEDGCTKEERTCYAERDLSELDDYYYRHVNAMTGEKLHSKSAIAAELAWRDKRIEEREAELAEATDHLSQLSSSTHKNAAKCAELEAENAELRADAERWKEYAQHQEWCQGCSDSVHDCETGTELREAAMSQRAEVKQDQ